MDALLSQYGLSLGGGGDAPRPAATSGRASIEDLQQELHNIVASKRSDTRAEHISTTLELGMHAVLYVPQEPEQVGDNLEQLQDLVTRTVTVSETVLNQPSDDPKLQRVVAKHLAEALAVVDESSWAHSLQAWNRQNSKRSDRLPIASFSGPAGLDPVNVSRPAFDCRGTLSIAFSKSNRAIVVKYEHTPLHKTVNQLMERLLPTLPPPPVPNANTPNVRSAKAKRPPPAEGEGSSRKKSKRKKKGANATDEAAQPDGQATSQPPEEAPSNSQPPSALNIPPLEAARRRDLANSLLSGRGIDPVSLSEEQFNIFSNQAPNLQEASLEMLSKYGAERLRIVHPDDKGPSASPSTTPLQQNATSNENNDESIIDTQTSSKTSKKRKSRARKSDAVVVEDTGDEGNSTVIDGLALAPSAAKRKKVTRGTCNTCKLAKRKCTKEHPQCSVCQELGETCAYLPPKPRKKPQVSADMVEDEDEDSEVAIPGNSEQPVQENDVPSAHVPPVEASHDDDEFIPDPNILAGPVQQQVGPPPYYQQPEVDTTPAQQPVTHQTTRPAVHFAQPEAHEEITPQQPQHTGMTFSNQRPPQTNPLSPEIAYPAATSNLATRRKEANARHSLPTAPPTHNLEAAKASSVNPTNVPSADWRRGANQSPAMAQRNATASPTLNQTQPTKGRSGRSVAEPSQPPFDGYQAAAVLAQTPVPVPVPRHTQSPALTRSPFQNAQKSPARAKSRQGQRSQRSQSRTPVTQTPVPAPVIPTSHVTQPNPAFETSTSASNASIPAYDPFARYNGTSNDMYSESTAGQSTRIAYEPNTYNQATTSASSNTYTTPSYGYSRDNAQSNPLNQALHDTTDFSNSNTTSNTNQWPSQARSTRSSAMSNSSNAYKSAAPAQTSQNQLYGSRASQHQTVAQSSGYGQPQQQPQPTKNRHQRQQSYNSYAQQPSGDHQQQNQNWYGFTSADSNAEQTNYNTSGNRNAGYNVGSSSANAGLNPNAYGQDLYDLLRHSGTH
ncbi:hypothetical protein KJ359_005822 [Pestalotiopsis sp. 9143b]|nr:hypothetical protein KJ359_005822 [Pestalotiopsis sp. 9143b]